MEPPIRRPEEILAFRSLREILAAKTRTLWTVGPADSVLSALQIMDSDELGAVVTRLLADPAQRETIGRAGRAAFEREQGGVLRTLGIIERVLDGEGKV